LYGFNGWTLLHLFPPPHSFFLWIKGWVCISLHLKQKRYLYSCFPISLCPNGIQLISHKHNLNTSIASVTDSASGRHACAPDILTLNHLGLLSSRLCRARRSIYASTRKPVDRQFRMNSSSAGLAMALRCGCSELGTTGS
jgi:hypothetical protein